MRTRSLMLPTVIPGALSTICTPLACSSVHVFLVRGTNDPYPGRQLPTAEAICEDWDCSWSSIEYPAVFNDYCESAETGIANLDRAVSDYATRCPDSKIVLSGHSQGGQVGGDYLGGGGEGEMPRRARRRRARGFPPEVFQRNTNTETDKHAAVIAASMFGSPRHNANQSYNLLVGARATSAWPREGEQLQELNLWSDKLRDYCNLDDPACAGGSNWTAHENYFELYKDDSAQFVRFKACQ